MPNAHDPSKNQFSVRIEKEYKEMMRKIISKCGDPNMTDLLKRLIAEEAKKQGVK